MAYTSDLLRRIVCFFPNSPAYLKIFTAVNIDALPCYLHLRPKATHSDRPRHTIGSQHPIREVPISSSQRWAWLPPLALLTTAYRNGVHRIQSAPGYPYGMQPNRASAYPPASPPSHFSPRALILSLRTGPVRIRRLVSRRLLYTGFFLDRENSIRPTGQDPAISEPIAELSNSLVPYNGQLDSPVSGLAWHPFPSSVQFQPFLGFLMRVSSLLLGLSWNSPQVSARSSRRLASTLFPVHIPEFGQCPLGSA
ncbi:hypothetical protein F5X99DRAFT_340680 [Biscogniauxia marginata]|nr:hypothetical protein F5X99DRAFT_340680 [Biscogniauxia marginata]